MRESRFVRIAKLTYHIAQQTLPTYPNHQSQSSQKTAVDEPLLKVPPEIRGHPE